MRLVPPRVVPPAQPLGRLVFAARFVRNPLEVVPREAYQAEFFRADEGAARAWVMGPALLKAILLDEREKFRKATQIRLLSPLLGHGLLTSEGAEWKWQRQACAPMFRQQELIGFVPVFVRAAQGLLARWRAAPGVQQPAVQPIDRDVTRATFEVVSATLLPSADATIGPVLEESMAAFQRSGGWSQLYASRRAGGGPNDLMHRLMAARDPESGQAMDDERLIDNLLTFYLAGHETTARALSWTLYLLSRSPEWSAALEDEVARVAGGEPVEAAHIERLALTQQVLKESMRLFPPVPMMSRQAVADTTLGGHAIRAGSSVMIPIYAIQRHSARWEDPHAFDPARFAPDREAALGRYQYLPFGAGPRICIGMAFAMIEASAILATLLQQARFAPAPGPEPYPVARVTLLPRGGMRLRVSIKK
ncbi:MAG: cytochrome P450 [Burkholderiales bacterium]